MPGHPDRLRANDFQTACLYAKANGFAATGKQDVMVSANNGSTSPAPGTTASY
jgi:hypothetical protein